jgi:hypothetical protein
VLCTEEERHSHVLTQGMGSAMREKSDVVAALVTGQKLEISVKEE